MRVSVFFCIFLIASPLVLAVPQAKAFKSVLSVKPIADPKMSVCPLCVEFMNQAINQLLQIILNGGVIGSCGALCGMLPNQILAVTCNLLCDYVGITEFINIIDTEDPDPIYICQLIDVCAEVNGGKVQITGTTVSPKSGPQGTTFTVGFNYRVLNQTGPGLVALSIVPPDTGFPFGDADFVDSQPTGMYQAGWQFQAQPSENEPFGPGVYQITFAVCEGDCTTVHPYGGIYAEANAKFTITA